LAWTVRFAAGAEKTLSGEAMQGDERAWRYRVGDWRLICDIVDRTQTIFVVRIGHRSDAYRSQRDVVISPDATAR